MKRMYVDKLGIDLLTHDPVIILKDESNSRSLPILIVPFEATAIALALEGSKVPRPLSHDIMVSIIEELGATVKSVNITEIKNKQKGISPQISFIKNNVFINIILFSCFVICSRILQILSLFDPDSFFF